MFGIVGGTVVERCEVWSVWNKGLLMWLLNLPEPPRRVPTEYMLYILRASKECVLEVSREANLVVIENLKSQCLRNHPIGKLA